MKRRSVIRIACEGFFFAGLVLLALSESFAAMPVDVMHYDLNCEMQFQQKMFSCKTKISIQNGESPLNAVLFYFESPSTVLSVSAGKDSLPFKQNEQKTDLAATLKNALKPSEQKDITVTYNAPQNHAAKDKGFSIYNAVPQNALAGGEKESFTLNAEIKIEKGFHVVGVGMHAGRAARGNFVTWKWKATRPYQEMIFFVDKFKEKTLVSDNIPVTAYLQEKHFHQADDILRQAKEAISFFSDVFGPYPYEKLSVVEMDDKDLSRRAIALPSFTLMSSRSLDHLAGDRSLIPHEVSHQWWGCLVPLGFFSETWLTEGFATYSECLFMDKQKGGACFEETRSSFVKYAAGGKDKSVLYGYLAEGGAASYDKGAWVLKMLQHLLGDENFFQMMHEYAEKFTGKIPKNRDLRKLSEKYYGQKLDWFFKEWLEATGTMELSFQNVAVKKSKDGFGFVIEGALAQKKPFAMPVEIKVVTAAYESIAMVWVEGEKTQFSIAAPVFPEKILLDPDKKLLLRGRPEYVWH